MTSISNKPLNLGGRRVRFAALSLRQLRELKEQINICMGPRGQSYLNEDAADALIDLLVASTKAAGDSVDREFLMDHIDTSNFGAIGFALFDKNSFLAKEGEEPAGEATAAPSPT